MCPNYGAKEPSTANVAWGRSNYSVVVRMVITSSLSSARRTCAIAIGNGSGSKINRHTCAAFCLWCNEERGGVIGTLESCATCFLA